MSEGLGISMPRGLWIGLLIFIGLPLFLAGMNSVIAINKLLSAPSINGTIPIWAIFVVIIIFFMYKRRNG